MTLLDMVKLDLGISHSKLDDSITAEINAACQELRRSGVNPRRGNPLIRHAVKLWCRGWFNFQGLGDRWFAAFDSQRNALALSEEHREAGHAAN